MNYLFAFIVLVYCQYKIFCLNAAEQIYELIDFFEEGRFFRNHGDQLHHLLAGENTGQDSLNATQPFTLRLSLLLSLVGNRFLNYHMHA